MAGVEVDAASLPEDVREKLAELDLELSEGKQCTIPVYFPVIFIHNYPLSEALLCFCSLSLCHRKSDMIEKFQTKTDTIANEYV